MKTFKQTFRRMKLSKLLNLMNVVDVRGGIIPHNVLDCRSKGLFDVKLIIKLQNLFILSKGF